MPNIVKVNAHPVARRRETQDAVIPAQAGIHFFFRLRS
jgi:hypothetical protein